jgi:hypothetical protein
VLSDGIRFEGTRFGEHPAYGQGEEYAPSMPRPPARAGDLAVRLVRLVRRIRGHRGLMLAVIAARPEGRKCSYY